VVAGVTLMVLVIVFFPTSQLAVHTFDARWRYLRVKDWRVDTFFHADPGGALIASMPILGVTLIAAALVIPAISARLLTDSFTG